jgi:hypothetical protein
MKETNYLTSLQHLPFIHLYHTDLFPSQNWTEGHRTYVRPKLNVTGHFVRRPCKRYFKAWYLGFLELQVIPRFTGTCISPVNRNRGILTSLMLICSYDYNAFYTPRGNEVWVFTTEWWFLKGHFILYMHPVYLLMNSFATTWLGGCDSNRRSFRVNLN